MRSSRLVMDKMLWQRVVVVSNITNIRTWYAGYVGRAHRIWWKRSPPTIQAVDQRRHGLRRPKMGSHPPTTVWMPRDLNVILRSNKRSQPYVFLLYKVDKHFDCKWNFVSFSFPYYPCKSLFSKKYFARNRWSTYNYFFSNFPCKITYIWVVCMRDKIIYLYKQFF